MYRTVLVFGYKLKSDRYLDLAKKYVKDLEDDEYMTDCLAVQGTPYTLSYYSDGDGESWFLELSAFGVQPETEETPYEVDVPKKGQIEDFKKFAKECGVTGKYGVWLVASLEDDEEEAEEASDEE